MGLQSVDWTSACAYVLGILGWILEDVSGAPGG